MTLHSLLRSSAVAISALSFVQTASAEIAVKSVEKIAFLGDSITQGGWQNPVGYVRLVMAGLAANGVSAEAVPAGISGHKSNDMLGRLERDVLSKKPQWMTLSCGVNDVWHGQGGVPLNAATAAVEGAYDAKVADRGTYEKNITQIVDQAQAAGVTVVLLTATVIHENLGSPENAKLAPFNEFLRGLAKTKKVPLADLNAMFQEHIKAANRPGKNVLTGDGVHMNEAGDKLMAVGVLRAFGLDAGQLAKAETAWVPMEAEARAHAASRSTPSMSAGSPASGSIRRSSSRSESRTSSDTFST